MNETTCPSCEAHGKCIGISLGAAVYQCISCKLCYLEKSVRANSDNDNHWYDGLSEAEASFQLAQRYRDAMGRAYHGQFAILEKHTDGRRLADIGCGLGVFLSIGRDRGWHVTGVDSSEHAQPFAAKHYGLEYVASTQQLVADSFDVVRISHVLEHVPEPQDFLQDLQRLLKPQGILAVIVPNREPLCATVVNKFRRLRTSTPRLAGAIYPDMHVLGFSPESLVASVGKAGFEVLAISTVSMGNPIYYPMFYDGLLLCEKPREVPMRTLIRYYLPLVLDNVGNSFGKGQWIVALFRNLRT